MPPRIRRPLPRAAAAQPAATGPSPALQLRAVLRQGLGGLAAQVSSPQEVLEYLDDPLIGQALPLAGLFVPALPGHVLTAEVLLRLVALAPREPGTGETQGLDVLLTRPDLVLPPETAATLVRDLATRLSAQLAGSPAGASDMKLQRFAVAALSHAGRMGRDVAAPLLRLLLRAPTAPTPWTGLVLRQIFIPWPDLDRGELTLLCTAPLGQLQALEAERLATHPLAGPESWTALLASVSDTRVYSALTRAPQLADHTAWVCRLLGDFTHRSGGEEILRGLLARPDLPTLFGTAEAMTLLVTSAPSWGTRIQKLLVDLPPELWRLAPRSQLAPLLHGAPRELRLSVLAALGETPAPAVPVRAHVAR